MARSRSRSGRRALFNRSPNRSSVAGRLRQQMRNPLVRVSPFYTAPARTAFLADRRVYSPETVRVARKVNLRPARVIQPLRGRDIPRFVDASRVLICVRRKTRREVLFAKRKTRKGASSTRRRNQWSEVSCV